MPPKRRLALVAEQAGETDQQFAYLVRALATSQPDQRHYRQFQRALFLAGFDIASR